MENASLSTAITNFCICACIIQPPLLTVCRLSAFRDITAEAEVLVALEPTLHVYGKSKRQRKRRCPASKRKEKEKEEKVCRKHMQLDSETFLHSQRVQRQLTSGL